MAANYERVNWKDFPDTTTPVTASNLNNMDNAIKIIDDSVTVMEDSIYLLNNKVSTKVDKVNGKGLSTEDYTTAEKESVATISNKVDKVDGKGLSTEDYTTAEKTKVSNLTSANGVNFKFGIDELGNYGYYKDGADTVTPFKSGEAGDAFVVNIFAKIYLVSDMGIAMARTSAISITKNEELVGNTVTPELIYLKNPGKYKVILSAYNANSDYALTLSASGRNETASSSVYIEEIVSNSYGNAEGYITISENYLKIQLQYMFMMAFQMSDEYAVANITIVKVNEEG